jgi:hypothetical protein
MKVPVTLDETSLNTNPLVEPLNKDGMFRAMERFGAEKLYDQLPLEVLLEEEVLLRDPSGRPIDVRPRYEFRFSEYGFSERGVIQNTTERQFMGILHYAFDNALQTLKQEQPQCDWRVVAVGIVQQNLRRTMSVAGAEEASPKDLASVLRDHTGSNEHPPVQGSRTRQTLVVPDYRVLMQIAWCDVSQSPLYNPNRAHGTSRESALDEYIKTRIVKHLPPGMRKQRERAVTLLKQFYAAQEPAAVVAVEGAVQARGELTPAQIDAARVLRSSGASWPDLAKVFNIPWQTIRSAVGGTDDNKRET